MKNVLAVLCSFFVIAGAQACFGQEHAISGTVVSDRSEVVPGVAVEAQTSTGRLTAVSDGEGRFALTVPMEPLTIMLSGRNIRPLTQKYSATDQLGDLQLRITFVVSPISESVTIDADALTPQIENRNDVVYKNYLFSRDDQLLQTLGAGINAGQHEGGGKSLEIRRFGFNLDHGGVNGGLKILVDDVQQNQGTQGHGQGYLGSLKSLSPELGIVRDPSTPKLATTDFYQAGTSYNGRRFSAVLSGFLIDRSNEQVYIPDDGSTELAGPT